MALWPGHERAFEPFSQLFYFLISFRHKTILSFHNERFMDDLNAHGKFWKILAIFFMNHIDRFIVDNQYCKELATSILNRNARIIVIPEYIPEQVVPQLKEDTILALRKKCKYLLSSNAFQISFYENQDLYGLDILVELVNCLINVHGLDVGMVFLLPNIGDIGYFSEINRRIKHYGLSNRFYIITSPVESAVSVWKISDIVIRATNTDGNSLTVLEALSMNVPVIASDCSERPEGTIIFRTRDVEDLCEKVRMVLSHLEFYRSKLVYISKTDNAANLLRLYKNI